MNIFILEDDLVLRKALIHAFTSGGHQVTAAENGQQALDLIAENRNIDMIICDVMVPDVSGPTLILMIKKYFSAQMPAIIIMSGISDGENFMNKLEIPFDHFLPKPIDFKELNLLTGQIAQKRSV